MPFELRMDGLPKIGCLRILAGEDGSDLLNLGLALSQASTMFFPIDLLRRFSLGAARSQFRSEMEGPLPWRGSLVWPALCHTSSFHGSPPGANPLTKSFASKASDWDLGSVTPSLPCAIGSSSVSHLTLARVGVSLPPPNKVSNEPPDLAAHLGIRVLPSGQVPYRSEKDLVRNQNPSCQREGVVAPDDELAFESKHHRVKVCLWGQVETHLDP